MKNSQTNVWGFFCFKCRFVQDVLIFENIYIIVALVTGQKGHV